MINENLKKTSYNLMSSLIGQAVILAIGLILPRFRIVSFGSEVNGLLSSVTQIYTYLALLEAGVGTATLQALYRPVAQDNKDDINSILAATNSYYRRTGFVYLMFVVGFAAIYPFVIATNINKLVIVAVILFNGLGNVLSYFFQGKYRILLQAEGKEYIISNLSTFVQVGSGITKIILLTLGCNVVSLQIAYFLFQVIQVVYFAIYIKRKYKWINLHTKPNNKALSQKNSVLVHQISQLVFNNTDILILTAFCGLETVSIYAVYNMVFDIVSTVINNINNSFVFKLGQLYNSQKEIFMKWYTLYECYYTALSFAFYSVLYLCIKPFINVYTTSLDIDYSLKYLPILFVGIKLLVSGRAPSGLVASWAGHFKATQNRAIIEMVINLFVSLILVQFVGIYGVLLGTIAALLYRANDMIIYANKKILFRNPIKTYKHWIVYLTIFAVIFLVEKSLSFNCDSYINLLLFGFVFGLIICIVYFAIAFLLSYKETVPLAKKLITRIKKTKK